MYPLTDEEVKQIILINTMIVLLLLDTYRI